MSNILNDTQQSLAAALARLEIHRLRIERLKLENVHLRNVLRAHNINPGEESGEAAAGDADAPANEAGPARSAAQDSRAEEPIQMPVEQAVERAEGKSDSDGLESHNVLLYSDAAKIPGRVSFKEDRIEFVAVAADIQPANFVGVRYLVEKPGQESRAALSRRLQPVRVSGNGGTWWDSLFGSQGDLPSAGSMPGQPPRFRTTPTGTRTPRSNHSESPALSPRTHPAGFTTVPIPPAGRTQPTDSASTASGSISAAASNLQEGVTSGLSQMAGYLRRRSLPESPVTWDKVGPGDVAEGDTGTWQVIWRELDAQGTLQTLSFEASTATRARIQSKVEQIQAAPAKEADEEDNSPKGPQQRKVTPVGDSRVRDPEPLIPGTHIPHGIEDSKLLSQEEAQCIAAAIPGRRKLGSWKRLYCSEEDGFSLQTLYRAGATAHHSVLLVEDFSGHVFGAYCTEALKVNPRYQGNGECFVFQLRPHRVKYDWHQLQGGARNDFFMMVASDSLGIGGAPHFAIWLDSDLLYGNSGLCHTFSSPCLAGDEDFKVKSVELWGIKS